MPYEPVQVLGKDEANDRISTCDVTGCISNNLTESQVEDKPGFSAEIAVQANR